MSDLEARLLARAEELAAELGEVAVTVTGILAGARAARVDPEALGGLVGAAFALGADQISVYSAGAKGEPPCGDETLFANQVSDAEDDVDDLLKAARRLRGKVRDARATARLALAAAYLLPTRTAEQRARRAEAIARARERIATCEAALAVLAFAIDHLKYARRRLRAVPSDLGETYESVYNLIRAGGRMNGRMPYDGDFITGGTKQERTG
jgi:hypothetical protein